MIVVSAKDCLFGRLSDEADSNRVLKDARSVKQLVGGSPYRRANHRSAGLSGEHVLSPRDNTAGDDVAGHSAFRPNSSAARFCSAICLKAKSWKSALLR